MQSAATLLPLGPLKQSGVGGGGIVVFSGGSAANNLVETFGSFARNTGCALSYVIPISDNGGSTSEILRVIGGPGIGDVRSRLVRLIPDAASAATHQHEVVSNAAIKLFFNHRLPVDSDAARLEWLQICEGSHALWQDVSPPKRELIRPFLNHLNLEIVKRARPAAGSVFDFATASLGNLFLTGARLFTGSFESSIYLLSLICQIPPDISVLPAINTNHTHHISAVLADGTIITGQNSISHPSETASSPSLLQPSPEATTTTRFPPTQQQPTPLQQRKRDRLNRIDGKEEEGEEEDANLPGTLPTLRASNLSFTKASSSDLPAPISRIFYINPYGHEIRPAANPKVLAALQDRPPRCVVYSIGSLFTSIAPSLVLRGVGDALAAGTGGDASWDYANDGTFRERGGGPDMTVTGVRKVLILNATIDRETGPEGRPFRATEFVRAIAEACESGRERSRTAAAAAAAAAAVMERSGGEKQRNGRLSPHVYRRYVTHVIYLEGKGTPDVNREELNWLGIECVRVYGRVTDGGVRYDGNALLGALEAIVGRTGGGRRNTMEN